MKLLIIGGSGLLGTEILHQLEALSSVILVDAPSHKDLDIHNIENVLPYIQKNYDKILLPRLSCFLSLLVMCIREIANTTKKMMECILVLNMHGVN
jgi:hypothetical protein